ncbi:peptide ABC transporter permease [Actinoplanes philippinensis]|uniref:Peptide/nickel transport system permease protein n=1 Tax=Actinoplanes philippinensis TaxID=35752 RepID=A0A1I2I976_9ACTN|nr:ABC transporter permease [Actinoplanes philippinensis]GIE78461.1 peptide ABC transporter permease [Actinoplanes philippinensis]SFF38929.1 peptide/nickel transport system permease protein [Actinoplanes philippinensis]
MTRYVLGRIATALGTLWAVYTVTFVVLYLLPGDPVTQLLAAGDVAAESLSAGQLADLQARYGLDRPIHDQYAHHLWRLAHLDLGESFTRNVPVSGLLADRLGPTLALGALAVLLAVAGGGAIAVMAVSARSGVARFLLRRLPAAGVSFPPFFVGLLLIQIFAFRLGWFPAVGSDGWRTLVLPAVTMAAPAAAMLAQVLTRSLDRTLAEPWVVTVRATGLSRFAVVTRHGLRNAAPAAVNVLGLLLGATVAEAVVAETLFSRDGLGRLVQEAVLDQDVPVVQAVVLVAGAAVVAINLVVDLIHPMLDPRVTAMRRAG